MNKANRAFRKALEKELSRTRKEVVELKKEYDKSIIAAKAEEVKKTGQVATMEDLTLELQIKDEEFIAANSSLSEEMDTLKLFIRVYDNEIPVFDDFSVLQAYLERYGFNDSDKADVLAYFLNKYYLFTTMKLEDSHERLVRDNIYDEVGRIDSFPPKRGLLFYRQLVKFHEERKLEQNRLAFLRNMINEDGELLSLFNAAEYEADLANLKVGLSQEQVSLLINVSQFRAQKQKELEEKSAVLANQQNTEIIPILNVEKNKLVSDARKSLKAYLDGDQPLGYLDEEALRRVFELLEIIGYTSSRKAVIKRNILENNKRMIAEYNNNAWREAQEVLLSEKEREFLSNVKFAIDDSDRLPAYMKVQLDSLYNNIKNQLVLCYKIQEPNAVNSEEMEFLPLMLQELAETFDMIIGSNYKQVLELN